MTQQLEETVTISQAKSLIYTLAEEHSILLLSPPGVGKSESIFQVAEEAGLPCRSLLGTQIAPEDVSGIPRIVGERSVFCPPRVLLPENPEPFCLFLDELPACAPDVQKAFYSLLLERRLGEHTLPRGTWVVGAGNRAQDRALVRQMSSALVNRVIILNVAVDNREWLVWAQKNNVRSEILSFITLFPEALARPVPSQPVPFSTPRTWTTLSHALDRVETGGSLGRETRRALCFGLVSAEDAAIFCAMAEESIGELEPIPVYIQNPKKILEVESTALWFILSRIRKLLEQNELTGFSSEDINLFLMALPEEHRFALLAGSVSRWGELGADQALRESLKEVTGLS